MAWVMFLGSWAFLGILTYFILPWNPLYPGWVSVFFGLLGAILLFTGWAFGQQPTSKTVHYVRQPLVKEALNILERHWAKYRQLPLDKRNLLRTDCQTIAFLMLEIADLPEDADNDALEQACQKALAKANAELY